MLDDETRFFFVGGPPKSGAAWMPRAPISTRCGLPRQPARCGFHPVGWRSPGPRVAG